MNQLIKLSLVTCFLSGSLAMANSAPKFDLNKLSKDDRFKKCCDYARDQVSSIKDPKQKGTAMKQPMQDCLLNNKIESSWAFNGKCKP